MSLVWGWHFTTTLNSNFTRHSSFHRGEIWDSEKLSNVPKVTSKELTYQTLDLKPGQCSSEVCAPSTSAVRETWLQVGFNSFPGV